MPASAAAPTRAEVARWAHDLYAGHVDRKDAAGFAAVFTPDASLHFGNAEPIVGRDAIRDVIAQFFTAMVALRHESKGLWYDGDTLILEAAVTYTRHDRREVTVQAVTIFRLAGVDDKGRPVADQCRIFVDLAPLFAPSA
jgi:ketosteroid isomerase-like protein